MVTLKYITALQSASLIIKTLSKICSLTTGKKKVTRSPLPIAVVRPDAAFCSCLLIKHYFGHFDRTRQKTSSGSLPYSIFMTPAHSGLL